MANSLWKTVHSTPVMLAAAKREEKTEKAVLSINGDWKVVSATENSLTLDRCDLYFDGELIEKDCYILSAMHKALALQKAK